MGRPQFEQPSSVFAPPAFPSSNLANNVQSTVNNAVHEYQNNDPSATGNLIRAILNTIFGGSQAVRSYQETSTYTTASS